MKFLIIYFKRISFLLIIYTTSRIFFYINNNDVINPYCLLEFIEGVRFDISAIAYLNIPLLVLLIFPHNLRRNYYYQKITNWSFYAINIPFIILNNIDIEYYKYTQKRSTIDFLDLLRMGDDARNIIPQYMKDYWPITLFTTLQVWLLLKIKHIPKAEIQFNKQSILSSISILIFATTFFIVSARGGLQLKPIKSMNAGELTGSENSALILNTPFCIIHSLKGAKLKPYTYFKNKDLKTIYSPLHSKTTGKINKQNIIILIMESYSKEFVGFYNNGVGYTTFLDSLSEHSLVFENAFANGLKSIEALPAITASIPTLMDNPFITSSYAQNNFKSIASILNKEGYNTSFYHGGIRGTMGFYSFSKKAGFTNYYGLEEYNDKSEFDGVWGIYDEPFMQYFANNLKKKKEPFFSTFFSLSSHPPFTLPEDYESAKEEVGIRETIKYSDFSMQQFFKSIKNEKWFQNTIFIITADHTTPISYNKKYQNKTGRYAIPLLIYKSDGSLKGSNYNIVQQIDIMPTLFELINYNKPYFSFGKSMFDDSWAISYLQNKYRFISDSLIILNKEEQYSFFSDWSAIKNRNTITHEEELLKAIKQTYNNSMINNKLDYEN